MAMMTMLPLFVESEVVVLLLVALFVPLLNAVAVAVARELRLTAQTVMCSA